MTKYYYAIEYKTKGNNYISTISGTMTKTDALGTANNLLKLKDTEKVIIWKII